MLLVQWTRSLGDVSLATGIIICYVYGLKLYLFMSIMDTLQEDENLVRCLKSNEYLVQEPLMHIYMELVILENRQA
jgi:hypothetical protein